MSEREMINVYEVLLKTSLLLTVLSSRVSSQPV